MRVCCWYYLYFKKLPKEFHFWHESVRSSVDLLPSEIGENYLKKKTHTQNRHLKSLEIALRAQSNEEVFVWESLLKLFHNCKSPWYFNQDLYLTLLSQLSKTETPLQTSIAKNTGHLLPSAPSQRAIFLWEVQHKLFSYYPQLSVPEAKFWASAGESGGIPSAQPPLVGWSLYLWCGATENTRSLITLDPARGVRILWWERQVRETLELLPLSTKCSAPKVGLSFGETCTTVLTPSSTALAQRVCCGKKQAVE